jgi:aspartate-semialdehyde dehydrogenase
MAPTVAIVGATGAVGMECVRLLEQRGFPHAELRLLASARSAGRKVAYRGREVEVAELGARSFDGVDLAFFAADAATSRAHAPALAAAGGVAIDKSSAYRMDAGTPLVIPEVNGGVVAALQRSGSEIGGTRRGGIVAVPNCSTIILLVPVEPLRRAFGVERVVVSTYQAASGAGAEAMAELEEQTRVVLSGGEARPRVFKEPCAFNVFSHDSAVSAETGMNGEEEKMVAETQRIWGDPGARVSATCVRVGVMRGHSEAITLTLKRAATEAEVRSALAGGRGIRIVDDREGNGFPTPLKATGGDEVLVGRIRPDLSQGWEERGGERRHVGWSLFVSGDQLRMGAALTAVKIAEEIFG